MRSVFRLVFLVFAIGCSNSALAVEYSFNRVYTGNASAGVAINDNGLVALIVSSEPPSLIVTDGTTTTTIAGRSTPVPLAYGDYHQSLSLNNNGFVSFRARGTRGSNAIWKSNGTVSERIADDGESAFTWIASTATSINDNGQVAFEAMGAADSQYSVFVGDGSSAAVQVNNHRGAVPAINNAGTIAYSKFNEDSTFTLEIQKGSEILSLPDLATRRFLPDINENGTVACMVSSGTSIVVGDGLSPSYTLDTSRYKGPLDSGFWYDGGESSCAINDANFVVFGAYAEAFTLPNLTPYGLFTGPDPLADKVIAQGDLLDGVSIRSLFFSRGGLNNKGQIAFVAYLSDGTKGVWVATPVPEPSTLALLLCGLLSLFVPLRRRYRRSP